MTLSRNIRVIAFTLCHCYRKYKSSNQIFDQCDTPGLGPADSLLDFGCGTGETTIAMAQVGHLLNGLVVNTASQIFIATPISVAFVCQCKNHYHHYLSKQGVLGKLGSPGKVLGVDISEDMIGHCSSHYDGQDNLSFEVQQEYNVF